MNRALKKAAIGCALALTVFFLTWKRLPKWILMRNEPIENVDAAFILMGSVPDRTVKAYELLHEGRTSRLVFVQDQKDALEELGYAFNGGTATRDYLARLGADPAQVEYLEGKAHTSTREEAETLVALAHERGWRHVAVVTSWYHTARAAWIFKRIAPHGLSISTVAAMSEDNRPEDWWRHERAFLSVYNEYLKWVYYLVKH